MAGYTSLFLLVVGVGCVSAAHLPGLDRRQDAEESTSLGIYHGKPADITKYPFMVTVHCNCGGVVCSGSIVSDRWIMVSGDCAERIEPGEQYVMAGSANASLGVRYALDQVVLHPRYKEDHPLDYNFGLIKVNQTIQFSENCNKINLPSESPKEGTHLTITGWGIVNKTDLKYPLLQEGKMKVISKEQCEKAYKGYEITFTDTMGCVFNKGQTTPCGGDMSDPLTHSGVLFYLVTAMGVADKCTSKALPAICADVQPGVSWIQEITGVQTL